MQTSQARGFLAASPGPRISHRPRTESESFWLDRPAEPPARPQDLGVRSWQDLLRWPLVTSGSPRFTLTAAGGAMASAMALLALPIAPVWSLLPPALAGLVLWVRSNGELRRAQVMFRSVRDSLDGGADLQDVVAELESALTRDPGNDAARFLLAAARLETGEALATLVQLAPLRDRYPDHGEVVLVAACAYAQLGLHRDCLRMIDALDMPWRHPVRPAVIKMQAVARRALGTEKSTGLRQETRE